MPDSRLQDNSSTAVTAEMLAARASSAATAAMTSRPVLNSGQEKVREALLGMGFEYGQAMAAVVADARITIEHAISAINDDVTAEPEAEAAARGAAWGASGDLDQGSPEVPLYVGAGAGSLGPGFSGQYHATPGAVWWAVGGGRWAVGGGGWCSPLDVACPTCMHAWYLAPVLIGC